MNHLASSQRSFVSSLCLGASVVLLLGIQASHAQELRWKFKEGDEWRIKCDQTSEVISTVSATSTTMTLTTAMELLWKVQSVNDDGEAVITQNFERLRMKLELPKVAEPISYDSASEAKPTGDAKTIAEAVQPLLKAQTRITLSPRGEIRGVELDESAKEMVEALRGGKALKSLLSEEGMTNVLQQSLVVLPENEVTAGDEWSHESTLATPLGPAKQKTRFVLLEPEAASPGVVRIQSDTKLVLAERGGEKGPALERQKQGGMILFDAEVGRLRSAEIQQELVTSSKLKDTPVQVKLTSTLMTTLAPK